MYIIYMILSLLGITSPYATNESKHGEQAHYDSSRVMADMMRNYHSRAETICLGQSTIAQCQGGLVQQNDLDGAKNTYGTGVVSVSDGKDNVVTFVPQTKTYKFNPDDIKGKVYNNLNKITGQGINLGYYNMARNSIVFRDGTEQTLPSDMAGYKLYDHMPILYTSLNGSRAAFDRGNKNFVKSDTTVIDSLRNTKTVNSGNLATSQVATSFTCADGSIGSMVDGNILCGSSLNNVPSARNGNTGVTNNSGNGSDSGGGTAASIPNTNVDGNGSQFKDDSGENEDQNQNNYNVNFSNDHSMKMGVPKDGQDNSSDSDYNPDANAKIDVNSGDNVPTTGGFLNNCQNVIYPSPDPTAATQNNFGYSYGYDYYVDLENCNTWVRPALDNVSSHYAITPQDSGILSRAGWGDKETDYNWFDWFGVDTEGTGIRNPQSPKWDINSTDCDKGIGTDIYTLKYEDNEAAAIQAKIRGTSSGLTACQGSGGENGISYNNVNYLITEAFGKSMGNNGPYLETPFSYWGMKWVCKPDNRDQSKQYLHYHITCVPEITIAKQENDYTTYGVWKSLIGSGNYPYGGLYSFGHKGSANLGGATMGAVVAFNRVDDNNYGVSSSGTDYMGQALGSYTPFVIQTSSPVAGTDGVTSVLRNKNCTAVNISGRSSTMPTGNCDNLMNGLSIALNKRFFDFNQALLQGFSKQMSQNAWASATSTFDGTVVGGTAGYPAQDSDGVWRWHVGDLTAPSFAAPNGILVHANTSKDKITKGNYFTYNATVPSTGIFGSDVNNVSNIDSPKDLGFTNGSRVSPANGNATTISSNGYDYSCKLGAYNGYDYEKQQLKYSVNCTITKIPPPPVSSIISIPCDSIETDTFDIVHVGFSNTGDDYENALDNALVSQKPYGYDVWGRSVPVMVVSSDYDYNFVNYPVKVCLSKYVVPDTNYIKNSSGQIMYAFHDNGSQSNIPSGDVFHPFTVEQSGQLSYVTQLSLQPESSYSKYANAKFSFSTKPPEYSGCTKDGGGCAVECTGDSNGSEVFPQYSYYDQSFFSKVHKYLRVDSAPDADMGYGSYIVNTAWFFDYLTQDEADFINNAHGGAQCYITRINN